MQKFKKINLNKHNNLFKHFVIINKKEKIYL